VTEKQIERRGKKLGEINPSKSWNCNSNFGKNMSQHFWNFICPRSLTRTFDLPEEIGLIIVWILIYYFFLNKTFKMKYVNNSCNNYLHRIETTLMSIARCWRNFNSCYSFKNVQLRQKNNKPEISSASRWYKQYHCHVHY